MSIKLVVSDMDGTILNCEKDGGCQMDPEILADINSLKPKGIHFAVVTGRNYLDALSIVEKEKLDLLSPAFIVGYNGAQIYNIDEKKLVVNQFADPSERDYFIKTYELALSKAPDDFIATFFHADNLVYVIKTPSPGFEKLMEKMIMIEENAHVVNYQVLDDINQIGEFYKVSFFYNNKVDQVEEKIALYKTVSGEIQFVHSGDYWIEILPKNTNKGFATNFLKKFYTINKSEVLAIGDSGNDLAMFDESGYSATRTCAPEYVKAKVSKTFAGGQSTFVSKVIQHYIK